MTELDLSDHCRARIRQRGMCEGDLDLVMEVASSISDDAVLVTDQDARAAIARRKREIQRLEHLRGVKLVLSGARAITAYHVSGRGKRRGRRERREKC